MGFGLSFFLGGLTANSITAESTKSEKQQAE